MTEVDIDIGPEAPRSSSRLAAALEASEALTSRVKTFLIAGCRTSKRFEVVCPASGLAFVELPDMSAVDAEDAVRVAEAGWRDWMSMKPEQRRQLMRSWGEKLKQNGPALVGLIIKEQGKPLPEAEAELHSGLAYIDWYADVLIPQREPKQLRNKSGDDPVRRIIPMPIGVVGAITPWNFPLSMAIRKIAPALAAGSSVVLKPSEHAPLCGAAVVMLAYEAGIPPHLVKVLTTSEPSSIGLVFAQSARVRAISMTGSARTGRWLLREASDQIKPVYLELGGNNPVIVCNDADIDAAVACAFAIKFRNAGQVCTAPNRFFLERSIAERFRDAFLQQTAELLGRVTELPYQSCAPLITPQAMTRIQLLLEQSVRQGAHIDLGGRSVGGPGNFFQPTLVWNVTDDMLLAQEELFGPIAPMLVFDNDNDVIARANATEKGLAGYVFTEDPLRAQAIASALEVGMVGINTALVSDPAAPFGGVKQSGIGREGGLYGLSQYVEPKYVGYRYKNGAQNDQ